MATQLTKKRPHAALINGQAIVVEPRQTVLQAALDAGIDFPNSCRVGGCGACKCRLTAGQVTELTETGYLLTGDELERGYILACQSVPRSDIELEVDLGRRTARRGVSGRIVGQDRLTHDIVSLRVLLDEPLPYKAGQFALLGIEGLAGVERSYSFAAPARDDGEVSFFVRKIPGGRLSSLVCDQDVRGRSVVVDGPYGDFWLRQGDTPLLLVAGGSGLAPILAILREALATGVSRSATLVFGAREARDLYALEEIEAIARQWRGSFRFVPVLSGAAEDATLRSRAEEPRASTSSHARGLVSEHLARLLEPEAHAYLCGPAGMIDASIELLSGAGVPPAQIFFDKFTTQADTASLAARELDAGVVERSSTSLANVLHYLKFFMFHVVGLFAVIALLIGGRFVTGGLLIVMTLYMLGDAILGDDVATPKFKYPGVLTAQLWFALPLLCLIVFAALWSVSAGDPLGFGAWLTGWSGYDVIAARDATGFGHHVAGGLLTGLMIGMIGTITAHELTHRTWDPVSMLIGRWLLAFSFDTSFAIEHVYGHHRYVSTVEDPATAPRGRNAYAHIVISTIRGNVSAWKIERERLQKKRLRVFSFRNAVLRGYLMSVLLVVVAWAIAGAGGALFFALAALWGKALLEIVNYMEHYGMVRSHETPVQPRHSWNTNKRVSSWSMFNLTRHSHHHAQGEVPYQDLHPYPNAPMMINGYLTTIVVALIPPLWHKLMTPRVLAWDRDFATAEERQLAAAANERSGLRALREAGHVAVPGLDFANGEPGAHLHH